MILYTHTHAHTQYHRWIYRKFTKSRTTRHKHKHECVSTYKHTHLTMCTVSVPTRISSLSLFTSSLQLLTHVLTHLLFLTPLLTNFLTYFRTYLLACWLAACLLAYSFTFFLPSFPFLSLPCSSLPFPSVPSFLSSFLPSFPVTCSHSSCMYLLASLPTYQFTRSRAHTCVPPLFLCLSKTVQTPSPEQQHLFTTTCVLSLNPKP